MKQTPVKQDIVVVMMLLGISAPAFSAPAIDFTNLGSYSTFNAGQHDTATVDGVQIDGFVYTGGTSFVQDRGYLWLRNNTDDHGFGYCSAGESCGAANTTGNGDANELSNESRKTEIIRLTRPSGESWSNIWVSSLDSGGTNNNETGTFYWSNSATPNLSTMTGITFSHGQLAGADEASIYAYLMAHGFNDVNANYLFFRAGSYDTFGHALNGTNNDYLVWGVNVAAVPEPEIYVMMGIGLALMILVARRKREPQDCAAI